MRQFNEIYLTIHFMLIQSDKIVTLIISVKCYTISASMLPFDTLSCAGLSH